MYVTHISIWNMLSIWTDNGDVVSAAGLVGEVYKDMRGFFCHETGSAMESIITRNPSCLQLLSFVNKQTTNFSGVVIVCCSKYRCLVDYSFQKISIHTVLIAKLKHGKCSVFQEGNRVLWMASPSGVHRTWTIL